MNKDKTHQHLDQVTKNKEYKMGNTGYKWGIFFNHFKGMNCFGLGVYINWSGEKYFYLDLFTFELAIGKTTNL